MRLYIRANLSQAFHESMVRPQRPYAAARGELAYVQNQQLSLPVTHHERAICATRNQRGKPSCACATRSDYLMARALT